MSIFKRFMSLFLALIMLVSVIPVSALGTETETSVDPGELTVESSNGFGDLLTQEITAYQDAQLSEEEEYEPGFSVTDLTFSGATATVTYDAMEEATLVVAIYTEDGLTQLNSGYKIVSPGNTTATVTISGEMPQYFFAAAYLLDTYDLSPLCPDHSTPLYTKSMQELLASTVEDYPEERVLQLDDDSTTNFAVYSEQTVIVEEQTGVNTVISANDETMTYIIGNADEQFTSLQPGDIVAYEYGDEQYIFTKVATIDIAGTTVTIHGAELDIDDVFSHLKLEGLGDSSDAVVDDSTASDGVSYVGSGGISPSGFGRSVEDDAFEGTVSKKIPFVIRDGVLNGRLTLGVDANFAFLKTPDRFYVKLALDTSIVLDANVEGKFETDPQKPIRLGHMEIPFAWGALSLVCQPRVHFEVSGKLSFAASLVATIGFSYDSNNGFEKIQSSPVLTTEISLEGTVFLGVDMHPKVEVAKGYLLDIGASLPVGLEITAKYSIAEANIGKDENPSERHSCDHCVELNFAFKVEFNIGIEVIKTIHKEWNVAGLTIPLKNAYFSIDHKKFGWDSCPYLEYRISVQVLDHTGMPVADAHVTAVGEKTSEEGKTNANGVTSFYLVPGKYTVKAIEERMKAADSVNVEDARIITLKFPEPPDDGETLPPDDIPEETKPSFPGGILGKVESKPVVNYGKPTYAGGFNLSSNFHWQFYGEAWSDNSVLVVSGTGPLTLDIWKSGGYYAADYWGDLYWKQMPAAYNIVLGEGITDIGGVFSLRSNSYETSGIGVHSISLPSTITRIPDGAFYSNYLRKITFNGDITYIGDEAFYHNIHLTQITLPDTVTHIGEEAFGSCDKLEEIVIPGSVKTFGDDIFQYSGLKRVVFEDGITKFGHYKTTDTGEEFYWEAGGMFYGCEDLVSVQLPGTLKKMPSGMFSYCPNLRQITIPDSVEDMGSYNFMESGITQIRIPEGVWFVGGQQFQDCKDLTSVELNSDAGNLGHWCFAGCSSLTSLTIPESVYYIGKEIFADCTSLRSLTFEAFDITDNNYPSINVYYDNAFKNCSSLTTLKIPGIGTLYSDAFAGCTSLETMVIDGYIYEFSPYTNFGAQPGGEAFPGLAVTIYYPREFSEAYYREQNPNMDVPSYLYTEERMTAMGSQCTWIPYTVDEEGNMVPHESLAFCANPPVEDELTTESVTEPTEPELLPEETLPEETLPEETEPTETVPEETIPAETEPAETIAEETVTAETEADETTAVEETQPVSLRSIFSRLPGMLTAAPTAMAEELVSLFLTEECEETEPAQTQPAETVPGELIQDVTDVDAPVYDAIFGGDYSSEILDSYTLQIATFSGLVPGEDYVLLALAGINEEDPLANLIHIDQGTASSSGKLQFEYVEREEFSLSYVMACGPSNKNLNDATITFPKVYACDGEQVIRPTVKYKGKTLTEDVDYTLSGKVSFSTAGEYTCYIRGIYDYTGTVRCTYKVEEKPLPKIRISGTEGMMSASSVTLTAKFSFPPDEGTQVIWSLAEGDEAYARIEGNGTTATLTAFLSTEDRTITVCASAPGNAEPAEITIHIYGRPNAALTESITLYKRYYDANGKEYWQNLSDFDYLTYRLNSWMVNGFGTTLTAIAEPEGAGTDFLWSSSDENIATVNSYGYVVFTGKPGTVIITVEAMDGSGVSADVTFRIEEAAGAAIIGDSDIDLVAGKTAALKVMNLETGKPVAAKDIVWTLEADGQDPAAFATISASGTLKAQKVVSQTNLTVHGDVYNKGTYVDTVTYSVTIYPAVTHVEIVDKDGSCVNGQTLSVDTGSGTVSCDLTAAVHPLDAMKGVTWQSSAKAIAEVDPVTGALTWKGKNGNVTLTATANDGSRKKATVKLAFGIVADSVTIGVKDKKNIIPAEEWTVESGKTLQLAADITSTSGTPSNKKLIWSSSDPNVKVSATGSVSTKPVYEETTVTITAVAADGGGARDTFLVKVMPKDMGMLILRHGKKNVTKSTIYTDMKSGGEVLLTAHSLNPEEIPQVEWKVSNKNIASVVNGKVTFKSSGNVTVTATDVTNNRRTATVTVKALDLTSSITISEPENGLEVASGKAISLSATCEGGKNKKVTWEILSGDEYAKITSAGKLTANKDITAKKEIRLRATAADGSQVFKDCSVTIRPLAQGVQVYSEDDGKTLFSFRSANRMVRGNTTLNWDLATQSSRIDMSACVYPYYDGEDDSRNAIQNVQWKSSAPKIADFKKDEKGNVWLEINNTGSTNITVTAQDGSNQKVSFKLNVVKHVYDFQMDPQVLGSGKSLNLAKILVVNEGTGTTTKKFNWAVTGGSGEALATISATGSLKAKTVTEHKKVNVTVTAVDILGWSETFTIDLYPVTTKVLLYADGKPTTNEILSAAAGTELQLTPSCEPQNAAGKYTWKSSNEKLAKVEQDGRVQILGTSGTVTITCTASDGSNAKATVRIKIG